jgi:hypothetical protein
MHEITWRYDAGMIGVIFVLFVPIIFSWLPSVALCSRGLERTLIMGAAWKQGKREIAEWET